MVLALSIKGNKTISMRKFGFCFLILSTLVLSSCSKNSNDDDPTTVQVDKKANLKATGDSAHDILSNDSFDKLLIEIGYVKGFRPTPSGMINFVNFLKAHTFKQNIELVYKELPSSGKETLTLDEIVELETENRTVYNQGSTLAIYIYFTDVPSDEDDDEEELVTLGAVYRNTSMVIHEATVWTLAAQSGAISITDVETATLNHEFGHLFGLVDLGTTPVNDHEDSDAVNHCDVQGCLMRGELQFGGSSNKSLSSNAKSVTENSLKAGCSLSGKSVLNMLHNKTSKGLLPSVPLDAECILDLQSNGGK